ncbi:hypothetical protein [Embleya hyalina]|uniref:Uncharacterized protein n=1 Tax=Embleya hyalina TaxID=516124 RepID=A0A401Z723_9ACTN|nr:hypothetical protein [Embleya hyalina]GCE02643.1 hypothetical protein EHYA_10422 [Embleya hyalina]
MTPDSTTTATTTTLTKTRTTEPASPPADPPGPDTGDAPDTRDAHGAHDTPKRTGFASATVPRHLARGAVGFGALVASLALLPLAGPVSLLLAPVGLLALRGCPMCWAIGLMETISAGRLRRSCANGRCELTRPAK